MVFYILIPKLQPQKVQRHNARILEEPEVVYQRIYVRTRNERGSEGREGRNKQSTNIYTVE